MRTVAVDILTGFLGSGKTTLLRHVLEHGLRGKPVAVIMNEIGEIGIDGKVVTGLANVEKMVELTSGCICCSIDDYRFDLAIQEIIDTAQPHLVIIESTGLADPEPLAYRVKNAGLGLDAVITVVDAANVERHLQETEVARAQIEAADFLVVNKLDLVDAPAVARLERRLAKLNPRAERMKTVRGALDSDVLFATRDWHCLFNFTCGRHELTWVKLEGGMEESQAVFIGRDLRRHQGRIEAALAAREVGPEGKAQHG